MSLRRGRLATVAVTLALTGAMTLAGCGRATPGETTPSTTPNTPATTAPTTPATPTAPAISLDGPATGNLTLWTVGFGSFMVDSFKAANPGVTINVLEIPWAAAADQFRSAAAANTLPDVALMAVPLAEYVDFLSPVPAALDTSGFFPGALQSDTLDGTLYAVPWWVDTRVLYYRTDLAQKAGWTTPPTTWDQFKTFLGDLQTKAGVAHAFRMQPSGTASFLGSLWAPLSAGAKFTNADGTKWTFNTPEWIAGYEYVVSLYRDGYADPQADPALGAAGTEFIGGQTAALIDAPGSLGALATAGGADFAGKFATAALPAGASSTSFLGGGSLVVFNHTKNPDAAWKLVNWITSPKMQLDFFSQSGNLPSIASVWDDPAMKTNPFYPWLAPFGEQLKTAVSPPMTTTWMQISAEGDRQFERMVQGVATVPDALAALQAFADSVGMG